MLRLKQFLMMKEEKMLLNMSDPRVGLQEAGRTTERQENAFVEWLKMNHFGQTDFLVAISSSGKSPNVLNAINHASDCLGYIFAIFGMDGESPFNGNRYEDNYIHIDSFNYGVIELTSEIILHGIVEDLVIE